MNKKSKKSLITQKLEKGALVKASSPLRFIENEKCQDGKNVQVSVGFSTPLDALQSVMGIKDADLASDILLSSGLSMASSSGQSAATKNNVLVQSLNDFQPKDVIEARLIAQATTVFSHSMKCLALVEANDHLPSKESYMNMAVKLMRIHNETIEVLGRYHRGGEQKVVVQHIYVNDTAKAVIGDVNVNEGGGYV